MCCYILRFMEVSSWRKKAGTKKYRAPVLLYGALLEKWGRLYHDSWYHSCTSLRCICAVFTFKNMARIVESFAVLEAIRQDPLTSAITCSSSSLTPKFCAWANFQIVKEAKRTLWLFVWVLLLCSYSSCPFFFLIDSFELSKTHSSDAVASLAPIPRFKTYLVRGETTLLKWWIILANLPLSEYHSASFLLVARDRMSYMLWKVWPRAY